MFGLPDRTIKLLKAYFSERPDIRKVIIFGSRALGTQKKGSDIDLALFSDSETDLSGRVKDDLEYLPTPYMFDVVDYHKSRHQGLKDHINRAGKVLFSR